ncbi:high-affinity zinc transporter periplasmic protein [Escherichia coli]|uniref:High-affinity zinc transporter periplasmic protein n=1 Tax=Escherichia coli TaxID=562 RepID=A0A377A2D9_ECOLX|nr:high-affinity zinc transporter periplasmic protein [Escherichia coli]
MQKPVSKLPEAKQVTIAQLEDVKPLLMKSIHGDDDDHDTRKKVTKITITAISTCIFGFPQR